ncbi:M15 family metallopeptidase [Gynurincola endophyticus]|uniref:M15 family metallopeptidase n=1 Tax=Gynurincola endophyticus TaxID=2479004 RepID=UPI000F8D1B34|nr:M15 family metallopeptidase [Gynurincola endophyticus]
MNLTLSPKFIFFCLTISFLFKDNTVFAQLKESKYGVFYVDTRYYYDSSVKADPALLLTDIRSLLPTVRYDLRYAGNNNFTGMVLYPSDTRYSFLALPALNGLVKAAEVFDSLGYDLVIFDAYRPYSITIRFWELIQNEDYVARPTKGSMHNRGLAVDLTLWDRKLNRLVDMGTDFDHFSDTAHHSFSNLPESVLQNRLLLKNTLEQFGFKPIATEWWHYVWQTTTVYPVLDIDFNTLYAIQKKYSK